MNKNAIRLPEQLTNSNTRLAKLGEAALQWKERFPEERDTWKPLIVLFQETLATRYCPMYRPSKEEQWGTLCDSGREGMYFRCAAACGACVHLAADYQPAVVERYQASNGQVSKNGPAFHSDDFVDIKLLTNSNPQDAAVMDDNERKISRAFRMQRAARMILDEVARDTSRAVRDRLAQQTVAAEPAGPLPAERSETGRQTAEILEA